MLLLSVVEGEAQALVTGANGFIGSRLVQALVQGGQRVKAFVRPDANLSQIAHLPRDRMRIAVGDVRSRDSVYRALAGCDRMYHLAANFALWDTEPERVVETAELGTRATLEAAVARKLGRVVVTSSVASMAPSTDPVPLDESSGPPTGVVDLYVEAKLAGERAAHKFADALDLVLVNPGAVIGPGDYKPTPMGRSLLEYLHWPNHPQFRYPATGGLSYVDVDDVARGHVLAMKKGRRGERYLLGGTNLSHRELATELLPQVIGRARRSAPLSRSLAGGLARAMTAAAHLTGLPPLMTPKLVRANLFRYSWINSQKASDELGYTFRPASVALRRSLSWYRSRGYIEPRVAKRLPGLA